MASIDNVCIILIPLQASHLCVLWNRLQAG